MKKWLAVFSVSSRQNLLIVAGLFLLRLAESLSPQAVYGDVFFRYGQRAQGKNRIPEAVAYYRKAVRFNPAQAQSYHALGVIYWKEKKLSKAIGYFQEAAFLRPNYYEAFLNLGLALKDAGYLPRAVAAFEKTISAHPYAPFIPAHHQKALTLLMMGDTSGALAEANQIELAGDWALAQEIRIRCIRIK